MLLEKRSRIYDISNDYLYIVITILTAFLVYFISNMYEHEVQTVFNGVEFLTLHTLLEFSSSVFALIIFNNCFYSHKYTKRKRLFILSITFFVVGCINFIHILSFKGLFITFSANSEQTAIVYCFIARLVMALGIFTTSITDFSETNEIDEKVILFLSVIITFICFYVVTYKVDFFTALVIKFDGKLRVKSYFEYLIMLLHIFSIFNFLKTYISTSNKYLIVISAGLVLITFSEGISIAYYKNADNIFNLLGHTYKAIGLYLVYHSIFKYNIDMPYTRLKDVQEKMSLYANNLEKIVDMRTKAFKEANDKLNKELDYAKVIQQSLLPANTIDYGNVLFRSQYIPCEKLSGDFYDIFEIDSDNIGMYVLDVTGHGIPAALLTMFSINNIKSNERLIKRYRGLKPHKNMKHFYDEFNKLHFPEEMHIVSFFATYNKSSKVLTYCSAGMNCYPIVIRNTGRHEFLDKSKGFPICQLSDFFTPEYESAKIELFKGDKVIFYTDGLIEKQKNSALDLEELLKISLKNVNNSIEKLNNDIIQRLEKEKIDVDDDITYFIMEVL